MLYLTSPYEVRYYYHPYFTYGELRLREVNLPKVMYLESGRTGI